MSSLWLFRQYSVRYPSYSNLVERERCWFYWGKFPESFSQLSLQLWCMLWHFDGSSTDLQLHFFISKWFWKWVNKSDKRQELGPILTWVGVPKSEKSYGSRKYYYRRSPSPWMRMRMRTSLTNVNNSWLHSLHSIAILAPLLGHLSSVARHGDG